VKVGVPTEIKTDEYRVALTPAGVRELVEHGPQAALLELRGPRELVAGQVIEPSEVDVRAAGRRAGVHRRQLDPVRGGVDEQSASLQREH
jgi:hypothetical protein